MRALLDSLLESCSKSQDWTENITDVIGPADWLSDLPETYTMYMTTAMRSLTLCSIL